jgi:hypothetical protein
MERERLEAAAAENSYLRGLFGVPGGLLAILGALGNWNVGPLRHPWVFLAAVALLGLACVPIRAFYDTHYGRVTLSTRQRNRATVAVFILVPCLVLGSFLLRSRTSWSLDLPLNPTAASIAVAMLVSYVVTVGLRVHHLVICGGLLVAGLLPVWTGGDPSNVGLVLAGVAIALCGIFDHLLLVRTFGPARQGGPRDGDVAA